MACRLQRFPIVLNHERQPALFDAGRMGTLCSLVGGTPLLDLGHPWPELGVRLAAKMEGLNPSGSVKDRPAVAMLDDALREGLIDEGSLVVESSSGNLAIALANACRAQGLQFAAVIDPHIAPMNRYLLERLGARVEIVGHPDRTGGFLHSRLSRVRELLDRNSKAYWPNQYENPANWLSHYRGTAPELYAQLDGRLDYFFAAVGSGGTITGCARYLKERDPGIVVVAVDVEGSRIFGGPPGVRHLPGAGSSIVPPAMDGDLIDEVIWVKEITAIQECRRLIADCGVFAGPSSGLVMAAVRSFFGKPGRARRRPRVATIFPDRGERYFGTVYDDRWVEQVYGARAPASSFAEASKAAQLGGG